MPTDTNSAEQIRKKILEILRFRGPGLPVQIASQTGISTIFAGAFLSELAGENLLKISHMKVGGSPLYFLKEQKHALEKFHTYLPGKEKEAFLLLREKGVLKDTEQVPAIRVALRALKDFALPFKDDNEIFWRFHSVTEEQVREIFEKSKPKIERKPKQKMQKIDEKIEEKANLKEIKQEVSKEVPKEIKQEAGIEILREIKQEIKKDIQLDIGLQNIKAKPKESQKPKIKRERIGKPGQSFLEEVKLFLEKNNLSLLELEELNKRRIVAKINMHSQVCLLIAYNKKRVTEKELIKAYKLSENLNLPYYILTKDNPTKKMAEAIEAYKKLIKFDKFD